MTQVQRWTGVVSANEKGGFVAYGDYLALLDRLEKAEKDAERYRWLRDGCDEKGNAASYIAANCYGMEWNALIDTAMEASK